MERAWTAQALPRFGDNRYLGTYRNTYNDTLMSSRQDMVLIIVSMATFLSCF
jgi:hypothetical protein